jgi:DNA-binding NtrC family response regulator
VRRAVLLCNDFIELKHLRQVLGSSTTPSYPSFDPSTLKVQQGYSLHEVVRELSAQLEKALIQHALEESSHNKSQAARLLKIGYKTLYRKLKEHNLD